MAKRTTIGITGLVMGLFLSMLVSAQQVQDKAPQVSARIIPDTGLIGDRFRLEVTVKKDLAQVVDFPRFTDNKMGSDTIEILSVSPIDTIEREGRDVTIRVNYELTCFDAGYYGLGEFPVLYADKNIIDTVFSEETLYLTVKTFDIDTTKQTIVDIKPPKNTPFNWDEFKFYLFSRYTLWILLALLLIGGGIYYYLKVRKGKGLLPARPSEPPHVKAIKELERIHAEKLWQNGKHKQYYTRITDVVRNYIDERYGINAMEMTTEEIMNDIREENINERDMERLLRLLEVSDLVKFAKLVPSREDNETLYDNAYYFIEETKLMPLEENNA